MDKIEVTQSDRIELAKEARAKGLYMSQMGDGPGTVADVLLRCADELERQP